MSYFTNEFSEEVWQQKYKFGNEKTVEDTWKRVAKDLASVEQDKERWEKLFFFALENFKFIPGGRITSNAGTKLSGTTYINCFVSGFDGHDQDSIEGIYRALKKQAQILKSEGGYGFCADVMRPRGSHIGGIGNQSPGAVKFLDLWDKSSEIITSGSGKKNKSNEKQSIRKGAQMVTMSCWHPDIIDFVTAKQQPGRLTKFNMSVLCTDGFMEAVQKHEPWYLVFPNYEKHPKQYKAHWDGNIDKWLKLVEIEPLIIYHKFDDAAELWNLIMDSTYNRNEPGVLFVDTINRMNNLWYEEWINATNPCGEQCLPNGGVCLLGSINLVHFIDTKERDWKYDELREIIALAVRMMDNVNDLTYVPFPEQKENLQKKRRIGLGVVGYNSALIMAGLNYGEQKALDLTEKLMSFFTNTAYEQSALLAKEKGAFPLYEKENYLCGAFISRLNPSTIKLIRQHGIRNSHLISIQPTGNSSVFANLISSGLEPIFSLGYYRTAIQPFPPEGLELPYNIDWENKTYSGVQAWTWFKEGDENLLIIGFDKQTYKYDRNRGLTKEVWVQDYGVSRIFETDWVRTAMDLTVDDHVNTMKIFANWVDSAISKTINLPNNYPYEDFKNVYIKAWESGIKGFTTYRAGTMANVLSLESSKVEDRIPRTTAPKRPKELECDVHHMTVKGKPYFVLIGKYEGEPYEVFAGLNGFIDKKISKGKIIKHRKSYKAVLEDDVEISPVNIMCDEHEDALTRMTSTSLRHGADVQFIVQQLEKNHGGMQSFSKAIARALKKYIPDGVKEKGCCPECSQDTLVRQEGCISCSNCSYSKCT
jgi:ribonucleoside-diphosphate reductase alpha chain